MTCASWPHKLRITIAEPILKIQYPPDAAEAGCVESLRKAIPDRIDHTIRQCKPDRDYGRAVVMSPPYSVDVLSDPGLPARMLSKILTEPDSGGTEGQYRLIHNKRQIPLRTDGTLDLDTVRRWSHKDEADLLVIITEIPRRAERRPKLVDLHFTERLAIISLPALGWLGLHDKLRRVLFDSLDALVEQRSPEIGKARMRFGTIHEQHSETGRSAYIASPWWRPGRISMVLGMIRTNEPLAAVPKLSGVLAAATGTAAFGIFYSSIWEMADSSPPWRLGLITGCALVLIVLWLLFANRLWERAHQWGSFEESAMYNAATVATLGLAVAVLYLGLFLSIFLTGLIVIDPGFMAQTMGAEASLQNYVDIAWLAASLGTVAGAVGSNFDSERAVRDLTNGRRQAQRYWQREKERNERS